MAYAFLVTYQAYYLIDRIGLPESDVARQIYLGTLAQSVALIVVSPLSGRISDRLGRRKIFVAAAAVIYAVSLAVIATAHGVGGYLLGMVIGGVGFGMYMAVDLALVVDVMPDPDSAAKDLGVMNIAGALPFALAPAMAPPCSASATTATRPSTSWPEPALSSGPSLSSRSDECGSGHHGKVRRQRTQRPSRPVVLPPPTRRPFGAARQSRCVPLVVTARCTLPDGGTLAVRRLLP